jgi:hypothetical protein
MVGDPAQVLSGLTNVHWPPPQHGGFDAVVPPARCTVTRIVRA